MSIENIDKLITLCGELHTLTDKLIARCDEATDLLRGFVELWDDKDSVSEYGLCVQESIQKTRKFLEGVEKKRGLTNLTGGE